MTSSFSRSIRRAVMRAAGLSAAAALAVLTVGSFSSPGRAPGGAAAAADQPAVQTAAGGAPMLPLFVRKTDGTLSVYEPKGTGGFKPRTDLGGGFSGAGALFRANISESASRNDLYFRMGGTLYYTAERGTETKAVGSGWDTYNLLLTPGNLGGTGTPDVLARDTAGALWLFPSRADGSLAARVRAGSSGWNAIDTLAGFGDYTGDGKYDLLARTPTGTLYLYPGTGNATADAVLGSRITVGTGWNAYTALVSTGDNDGDGKADLIARDANGALWLFKGTGDASAPFAARVQIGTSGWNAFNAFF